MLIISRDQAFERWDTLPDNLREALFDDVLSATLWSTCEKNHLREERTQAVATVAGDVLMGFLHPDPPGVAEEIAARAGIPKQGAAVIAEELYRKIFLPFKTELEKNYAPPGAPSTSPASSPLSGKEPSSMPFEERSAPRDAAFSMPQRESLRETAEQNTVRKNALPEETHDTPFILHEEKEFVPPTIPRTRPSVTFDAPSLSRAPAPPSKPIIARVETPDAPQKKDDVRVVHYSNMRTPLDKS